jgi:hypothetical protein
VRTQRKNSRTERKEVGHLKGKRRLADGSLS